MVEKAKKLDRQGIMNWNFNCLHMLIDDEWQLHCTDFSLVDFYEQHPDEKGVDDESPDNFYTKMDLETGDDRK